MGGVVLVAGRRGVAIAGQVQVRETLVVLAGLATLQASVSTVIDQW